MRENDIEIAFFPIGIRCTMHRNLSLCSSIDSKRARGEENAKQTLDARARKHAKNTQREEEEEEEEEEKNNDAPVYCSTSDFTHPSNPSSNVSKNAAPSTVSRLADADDANAATVVAHAIVFFKP